MHERKQAKAAKANLAKDYPNAIRALESLKSNRSATALFDKPSSQTDSDPNATAIPEMLTWLKRAGYTPESLTKFKHIHIAGTKGKGSVASYATSLLMESSRHLPVIPSGVGTYKSPHLISPRERIQLSGEPLTEKAFANWFWQLWDRFTEAAKAEGMDDKLAEGPESKPFFFRFMTILAWLVFERNGVKTVVMECGIGGEYDATNVLPKEAVSAAVVTSLGLDHTSMLGDTVEKIAWHKAGIFKQGRTAVVLKDEREGVRQVLKERAGERDARLLEIDQKTLEQWEGVSSKDDHIAKMNQALAVVAVRNHLSKQLGTPTDDKVLLDTPRWMLQAMSGTKLPGVREVVKRGKEHKIEWLLDGAHTKESLYGVAAWLGSILHEKEQVILIFNQYDRDVKAGLKYFLTAASQATRQCRSDIFSHIIVFAGEKEGPYDLNLNSDEEGFEMPKVHFVKDAKGALRKAEALAGEDLKEFHRGATERFRERRENRQPGDRNPTMEALRETKVLVTGSFHLVGDVMKELGSDERAGWPKDKVYD